MSFRTISAWTRDVLRAAACAALAATAVPAPAADPRPESLVIDPDDVVLDHPQAEWAEAYLQWVAAFPRGNSPVTDTTGALCAAKQDGDVWFLAGSDGTGPVERRCSVPQGKVLFVPVAGTVERSGNKDPDCASLLRIAGEHLTRVSGLSMSVDGLALYNLESFRQATGGCFAPGLRQSPRSSAKTSVADGWYVMLRPLPPGPHTLAVGARFDATVFSTTWHLDVH